MDVKQFQKAAQTIIDECVSDHLVKASKPVAQGTHIAFKLQYPGNTSHEILARIRDIIHEKATPRICKELHVEFAMWLDGWYIFSY